MSVLKTAMGPQQLQPPCPKFKIYGTDSAFCQFSVFLLVTGTLGEEPRATNKDTGKFAKSEMVKKGTF